MTDHEITLNALRHSGFPTLEDYWSEVGEISLRGEYYTAKGDLVDIVSIGTSSVYGTLDAKGHFWYLNGKHELDDDLNIIGQRCNCSSCTTVLPLDHPDGICDPCWEKLEDAHLYPRCE